MTSRRLSEAEFEQVVVPCVREALAELDPWGEPFTPALSSRMILFPVGYCLEPQEIAAVAAAAGELGDEGFFEFMTELEAPSALIEGRRPRGGDFGTYDQDPAWYFALDDLDAYDTRDNYPFLETVLVSATGRWAILASHEQHAVIGGPEQFCASLTERFPDLDVTDWVPRPDLGRDGRVPPSLQVRLFLDEVRTWTDPMRWLPRHLEHIYGASEAASLLAAHGFTTPTPGQH